MKSSSTASSPMIVLHFSRTSSINESSKARSREGGGHISIDDPAGDDGDGDSRGAETEGFGCAACGGSPCWAYRSDQRTVAGLCSFSASRRVARAVLRSLWPSCPREVLA